jgi:hypothetical protein
VLVLTYKIWCLRNKRNCFEGIDDVVVIVQKAQRSILIFKSVGTILFETLSGGLNLPIYDVH